MKAFCLASCSVTVQIEQYVSVVLFFLLKRLEQYLCNAAFHMHITVCCQMNASEAVFSNGTVYYVVKCGSNV